MVTVVLVLGEAYTLNYTMAGADICDTCSVHVHIREHVLLMRPHIPDEMNLE